MAPDTEVTVREAELDLADALMDTLGEVDLDSLHDDYRAAVEAMITAKVEGGVLPEVEPAERGGQVIDLMAALESSVRAAKEARGEEGAEVAEVTSIKGRKRAASAPKASGGKKSTTGAAKKTAASKSAASKSTAAGAKKAAAKKTAAKKAAAKSTAKKATPKKRASA